VLIDEYDRFANQLLVDSYYQDRARLCFSVLCLFLRTLKSIGGGQEMRSFITSIMPLALADASGYNAAVNLTHDPWFASLVGFPKCDLERGLALIPHLNTAQREGALTLMRKYYNGFVFYRATEPLYNPTLSLHFLQQVSEGKLDVDELLAMDVAGSPALLARLSDTNVKLSSSFLRLARSVPAGERAVAELLGASAPLASGALEQVITFDELLAKPSASRTTCCTRTAPSRRSRRLRAPARARKSPKWCSASPAWRSTPTAPNRSRRPTASASSWR
jgi:hypothetical protein